MTRLAALLIIGWLLAQVAPDSALSPRSEPYRHSIILHTKSGDRELAAEDRLVGHEAGAGRKRYERWVVFFDPTSKQTYAGAKSEVYVQGGRGIVGITAISGGFVSAHSAFGVESLSASERSNIWQRLEARPFPKQEPQFPFPRGINDAFTGNSSQPRFPTIDQVFLEQETIIVKLSCPESSHTAKLGLQYFNGQLSVRTASLDGAELDLSKWRAEQAPPALRCRFCSAVLRRLPGTFDLQGLEHWLSAFGRN